MYILQEGNGTRDYRKGMINHKNGVKNVENVYKTKNKNQQNKQTENCHPVLIIFCTTDAT